MLESIEFWENIEYVSIVAIIAGVAGEYISDFKMHEKTEKDKAKKTLVGKISTLVLIGGLAVELLAIGMINKLSGEQIALLEHETGRANAQAELARESSRKLELDIAEANARTKFAEARIAVAGQQAATAGTKAAEANERAGALELEAATQREKAAIAERSLLDLQERIEPRRLSEEQRGIIADKMRSFAGTSVNLRFQGSDFETLRLANDIDVALVEAGWKVHMVPQHDFGRSIAGIFIEISPDADFKIMLAGQALANSLPKNLGAKAFVFKYAVTEGFVLPGRVDPKAKINITIGSKKFQ